MTTRSPGFSLIETERRAMPQYGTNIFGRKCSANLFRQPEY
jgi:hypothetical protein